MPEKSHQFQADELAQGYNEACRVAPRSDLLTSPTANISKKYLPLHSVGFVVDKHVHKPPNPRQPWLCRRCLVFKQHGAVRLLSRWLVVGASNPSAKWRIPLEPHSVSPPVQQEIPIRYINPVFRPPSEAQSLILPVTNGCSWNKCTYCEMYTEPQKKFAVREEQETLDAIARCAALYGGQLQRVFLGDGDAMALSTRRLMTVLEAIKTHLPAVRRVSTYCLPRNLRNKTVQELTELHEAGLTLAYIGAESGDNTVLQRVNKGETFESTFEALDKLRAAGITRSVMLLNGLGGRELSHQHAENSARLINATQPEFLATLVVSFPQGEARFRQNFPEWEPLDQAELFVETAQFLQALELKRTVFRSDHASNWLALKGVLGAEKARLLAEVQHAIDSPQSAPLRHASQRGL